MSKAQLVITAVVLEGRSKTEVARDYEVSRYWVQQLVKRYESEGPAAYEGRSRRPHHNSQAVDGALEDKIVRLRKTLTKQGYDAGAATIAEHLARDPTVAKVPAVSTIWRILSRRGFVIPQPQKRPRSSWKRFEADLPNQCWQADVTHWQLADHTTVEILNIIDDHSRLGLASHARRVTTGPDVVDTVLAACTHWGTPAALLTDNGAIFTATPRRGRRTALQITLGEFGINYIKLPALPSPDLRKSRALPPNPQKAAHRPTHSTHHHRIASPDRRIPHLLQHHPTPPGPAPAHPTASVHRPAQSLPRRPPHRAPLPGTPRQNRRRRRHHPPLQQPPAPHRPVQTPPRHPRPRAHRQPRHPRPGSPHRPPHPQTRPRPHPRLPTTRRQMRKLTRKQAQGVNHVSGHLSTMSRDMTWSG